MRISDWSSDVCSSDLRQRCLGEKGEVAGIGGHQASLWGKYRFAIGNVTGLSVGAGVRWLGGFQDGAAPRTPSVTLVDTLLAYETPSWRYALNVNNLLDKTYVSTCLDRGDCRSEEHTSELQSLLRISYAVFCLKKKNKNNNHT